MYTGISKILIIDKVVDKSKRLIKTNLQITLLSHTSLGGFELRPEFL